MWTYRAARPIRWFIFLLALPVFCQNVDVAVSAAGGVSGGDDQATVGVTGIGASIAFPHASKHRFQLDYLFQNARHDLKHHRHFLTGSYVVQAKAGAARPFFHIGGGVVHRRFDTRAFFPPDVAVSRTETDTSLAVLLGGGATIDVGKAFFIRPEVRLYTHVGPTWTVLPTLGVGWRF